MGAKLIIASLLLLVSHYSFSRQQVMTPPDSTFLLVDSIKISGNKVTKERVFYNELTKKPGDTLRIEDLNKHLTQIKRNLENISLFNFVWITPTIKPGNLLTINIEVQERWYWWVMPIIEHADRNVSAFLDHGDWSRMRYGAYVQNNNFLGRRNLLRFRFKVGYQNVLNLTYQSAQYRSNFGWGLAFDYLNQSQIQVKTENDKPVDYEERDDIAFQKISARSSLTYRHNFYHRHQLTMAYTKLYVADSVLIYNPDYLYKEKQEIQYLEFLYKYTKDLRDSKIYPLRGYFIGVDLSFIGSGIWEKGMNYGFSALHLRRYMDVGKRFNFGTEWDGFMASNNDLPYFVNFGLGYEDFINGYEYYVIEGSRYFTSQNRLMFNLLPTKTANIKFIPWGQFSKVHYAMYLKTFCDFGYIYNQNPKPTNILSNRLIGSIGLGFDFVTYYDKVIGLTYAYNRSGGSGFYVHINLKM